MALSEPPVAAIEPAKSTNFWFDRLVGGLELLFAIFGLVPVALMGLASYDEPSQVPGLPFPLWQGCAVLAVLLALHVPVGVDLFKGRRRGVIGLLLLTLAPLPFFLMAESLVLIVPSLLLVAGCASRLRDWGPKLI